MVVLVRGFGCSRTIMGRHSPMGPVPWERGTGSGIPQHSNLSLSSKMIDFFLLYAAIIFASCLSQSICHFSNQQKKSSTCREIQKSAKGRPYPRTQTSKLNKLFPTCRMQSFAPKRPPTKWGPAVLAPLGAFGSAGPPSSGGGA